MGCPFASGSTSVSGGSGTISAARTRLTISANRS
jgi:hypothetical protein